MAEARGHAKKKGTTVPLTTFLRPESSDWADEDPEGELGPPLPTAPGSSTARSHGYHPSSPQLNLSELPTEPPFKAFVGNLMPTIHSADIGEFFQTQVEVVAVNILRHFDTQKVKGAFVEVSSQDDLVKALQMDGATLLGRPMRVNVATSGRRGPDFRPGGERDDRYGGGEDRRRGFNDRNRGFDDRKPGYGDNRGRDFERDRNADGFGDRGGPFADRRSGHLESYRSEEDSTTTWGHKAFVPSEAPKRQPAPLSKPQEPEPEPSRGPKRLNLAPRTVKADESQTSPSVSSDKPSKSNPFGSAKPVDQQAHLKRIEEKIAAEKAELREAEEKKKAQEQEKAQAELQTRQSDGNSEASQPKAAAPSSILTNPAASPSSPPAAAASLRGGPASSSPQGPQSHRGTPPNGGPASKTADSTQPPPGMGPPGMMQGRGERGRGPPGMGRGRGRGRDFGRGDYGRGDFGRGRGDFRGSEPSHIIRNPSHQSGPPVSKDDFREAGRPQIRNRGWETRPPSSIQQANKGGQSSEEGAPAKTANIFDALQLDE